MLKVILNTKLIIWNGDTYKFTVISSAISEELPSYHSLTWNTKEWKHFLLSVEKSFSSIKCTVPKKRGRFSIFFCQKLGFQKPQNNVKIVILFSENGYIFSDFSSVYTYILILKICQVGREHFKAYIKQKSPKMKKFLILV